MKKRNFVDDRRKLRESRNQSWSHLVRLAFFWAKAIANSEPLNPYFVPKRTTVWTASKAKASSSQFESCQNFAFADSMENLVKTSLSQVMAASEDGVRDWQNVTSCNEFSILIPISFEECLNLWIWMSFLIILITCFYFLLVNMLDWEKVQ